MSLQAILDSINASGISRVREIEARCQQQVDEILNQARIEAQRLEANSSASIAAPAYRERARILHQAHLEALQTVGESRQVLLDTALGQVKSYLAGLRDNPAYPQILHKLTEEALLELQGSLDNLSDTLLEVDLRDQSILVTILQSLDLDLPVDYDQDLWGGLIARSKDNQIKVINSLESRLERAEPFLRRYLSALFETRHHGDELESPHETIKLV